MSRSAVLYFECNHISIVHPLLKKRELDASADVTSFASSSRKAGRGDTTVSRSCPVKQGSDLIINPLTCSRTLIGRHPTMMILLHAWGRPSGLTALNCQHQVSPILSHRFIDAPPFNPVRSSPFLFGHSPWLMCLNYTLRVGRTIQGQVSSRSWL